jgi:hypothetical protein
VEGRPAIDQVYIGSNNTPPALTLAQPTAVVGSEAVKLTVDWQSSDAEGDACTVDLYWTDKQSTDLITVAENLDAVRGTHFAAIPNLPIDRPVYIHAIARDSKGAVTQVTSSAVRLNQDPESEITAILTGEIPGDPAADANNDETLDAADVTTRINDGGPDPTR